MGKQQIKELEEKRPLSRKEWQEEMTKNNPEGLKHLLRVLLANGYETLDDACNRIAESFTSLNMFLEGNAQKLTEEDIKNPERVRTILQRALESAEKQYNDLAW